MDELKKLSEWMNGMERRVYALETLVYNARETENTMNAEMNRRYGIAVSKSDAARMLNVTRATVYTMIKDGRLTATSDGKRVVTRSIVAYLCGTSPWKGDADGTDALEESGQS